MLWLALWGYCNGEGRVMTQHDWAQMLAATAQPDGGASALALCRDVTVRLVGARLFTVMVYDPATQLQRRIFTDNAAAYPVSGEKPLSVGPWSEAIIDKQVPFVGNSLAELAVVFPDHALIGSLGLGSVLNVPIVIEGAVRSVFNMLHEPDYFTPERVATALMLRPAYALASLAAILAETSAQTPPNC